MTSNPEMATPSVEDIIERNKQYAETVHQPRPTLLAMCNNDMKRYGPHLLVGRSRRTRIPRLSARVHTILTTAVACLDYQCNPYNVLGLKPYECAVIRNVSGRFHTAAAEIAALDTAFHLERIIVLHRSNCGATHITKQDVLDKVRQDRPDFDAVGGIQLAGLEVQLPVREDNPLALREDLKAAKMCGFIRKELLNSVVGLYLDVDSGLVKRIHPATDNML
ncbi:hypothetical protein LTR10_020420 [Elasticomyces elasticus]|nr:hypothetical protein LTR10_020420 [Elasticomyces elasticus]KAK5027055.1 hypothetical protein LTS07_007354 [Exophiala sideris]KAK5034059.1 hypothetical protein LTR13_006659 [Exophiala sideris]KAK5181001.1 hypothetical protein LTR44_006821 [Eurotiomycetes sp. CCFEE 6388]